MPHQLDVVSAPEAARRAVCLVALLHRVGIETVRSPRTTLYASCDTAFKHTRQRLAAELNGWLSSGHLWDALSNSEKTALSRPAGRMTSQELIDGSWRAEALVAMLWALHHVESLPAYDALADPRVFLEKVPVGKDVSEFVANAELRPRDVLHRARDEAELWHWRARTYQIQRSPDDAPPPDGRTYAEIVRATAARAEDRGVFVAIEGDFPAFGKAYRDAGEEEWSKLSSIASERHYALNWLCGDADDWDHVLTDT